MCHDLFVVSPRTDSSFRQVVSHAGVGCRLEMAWGTRSHCSTAVGIGRERSQAMRVIRAPDLVVTGAEQDRVRTICPSGVLS
jgi:hypothetical protein